MNENKKILQRTKEYENIVKRILKPVKILPLEKVIKFISDYKVISSREFKNGFKTLKLKKIKNN
ncbi:MAG: hypothetical protein B6U87_00980 [Candidatus Aenigmarchaeota archaeon ex4484_52]|nr:MAG: hypothetical protein B6U87_00980 [Candidatus Aenigmarchaeota archaeon ex4484_52]